MIPGERYTCATKPFSMSEKKQEDFDQEHNNNKNPSHAYFGIIFKPFGRVEFQ
jgi:hypothetical protein